MNALGSYLPSFACTKMSGQVQFAMQSRQSINIKERTATVNGPQGATALSYDLLVGADGYDSVVRRAFVAAVKYMNSSVSFVGPMRYVTVPGLSPDAQWSDSTAARIASSPLENLMRDPKVSTSGTQAAIPCVAVVLWQHGQC